MFVQNNNIYYLEDYDYQNPRKQATQITFDGVQDEIFNGIPDWVYEGLFNLYFILFFIFQRS